jgi:hypothetical protein
MLSSPEFLYVTEVVEPDPDNAGRLRLDGYSKAARLSLFLWDSLPDEQLLDAAEAGELHERAGLARQIERMLEPTRLERGVRAFFSDFLRLEDFVSISKDPVIYPAFTYEAGQGAHEQTLRMVVDHLLTRHADYRELFTSEHTFVDGALGPLYQSAVPSDARRDWIPLQMERARSAGLLTSVSFLASHSHPGRSSPTLRGLAIREIFLCQEIPDPPPNVDFKLFEGLTGQMTARDRLRAHSTDPVCVGCHKLTDPIGLALENFDGAGQFRTVENGTAIDASGEFDGQRFSNVAEFGRALHDHPALAPCLAKRLYAYGVGRDPGKEERQWLRWIVSRFESDGYRFPELLREIASSSAFYAVSANEQSAAPTMADAG